MTCDATASNTLTAGDDLVWSWTTSGTAGWSDLAVEMTDKSGVLLASSDTEEVHAAAEADGDAPAVTAVVEIHTDGGLGTGDGEVPATNFGDDVVAWWIAADDSEDLPSLVYVAARAKVLGVDTTWYPRQPFSVQQSGVTR